MSTAVTAQAGWVASPLEEAAAIAAATALKEGKSEDEQLKAAQQAVRAKKAEASNALESYRRYLLAVCRYGGGHIEDLNVADLADVAALCELRCATFKAWAEARRSG